MVNSMSHEHRELFRDLGIYLKHCENGPERDRISRILRDSLTHDDVAGLFRVLLDASLDGDRRAAETIARHLPAFAGSTEDTVEAAT